MAGQASSAKKASRSTSKSSSNGRSEGTNAKKKRNSKSSSPSTQKNEAKKSTEASKNSSSAVKQGSTPASQQRNTGTQANPARNAASAQAAPRTAAPSTPAKTAAMPQASAGPKDSNQASAFQLVTVSAPISAPTTTAPALEAQGVVSGIGGGVTSALSGIQGSLSSGIAGLEQSFSSLFKAPEGTQNGHPLEAPPATIAPVVDAPSVPTPAENILQSSPVYDRAIYYLTPKEGALKDATSPSAIIVDISHNLQTLPPLNPTTLENVQAPKTVPNAPSHNSSALSRPEGPVSVERPVNSEQTRAAPGPLPSEPPRVQENGVELRPPAPEQVQEAPSNPISLNRPEPQRPSVTPESEPALSVAPVNVPETSATVDSASEADSPAVTVETFAPIPLQESTSPGDVTPATVVPAEVAYGLPPDDIVAQQYDSPVVGSSVSSVPSYFAPLFPTSYANLGTAGLIEENMRSTDAIAQLDERLLNPEEPFTASDFSNLLAQGSMSAAMTRFYFGLFLNRMWTEVLNLIIRNLSRSVSRA